MNSNEKQASAEVELQIVNIFAVFARLVWRETSKNAGGTRVTDLNRSSKEGSLSCNSPSELSGSNLYLISSSKCTTMQELDLDEGEKTARTLRKSYAQLAAWMVRGNRTVEQSRTQDTARSYEPARSDGASRLVNPSRPFYDGSI